MTPYLRSLRTPAVTGLLLVLLSALAPGAVREVDEITLTVRDLRQQLKFYTAVLPFQVISEHELHGPAQEQLNGVAGVRLRTARLKLGEENISLRELAPPGRPIPPDSRSDDHWFQHIAIVVSDMDKAYAHLARHKVRHVSTAPQTLPAWNQAAGGIKAFYFRDPEGHVLELIWFPPGKGDPRWQGETSRLFLGIDHTAIVVADTERSLAFYRDGLGLRLAGHSENHGPEQERLNQVFGARLRITSLRAGKGPGIEFLEYIAPPGGRTLPSMPQANDATFWLSGLVVEELDPLLATLRQSQVSFVSRGPVAVTNAPGPGRACIVLDPDGHAIQLKAPLP